MKIFWQALWKRVLMAVIISGIFLLIIINKMGMASVTIPMIAGWCTSLLQLWLYRMIAKRRKVTVEDIIYAVFELEWPMQEIQFNPNFKADYEKAKQVRKQIADEMKKDPER